MQNAAKSSRAARTMRRIELPRKRIAPQSLRNHVKHACTTCAVTAASPAAAQTSACDTPAIQTARSEFRGHRLRVATPDEDLSGHPDKLCPSKSLRGREATH